MLRKALFSFAALLVMTLMAVPVSAATTFNWTDLSSQLTVRTNRPVWAMAYANGNWFYTDGQDLWNGGQVYRYDGTTQTNITLAVRNAGINRVDDIVSDGQSVLFLKNVTTRNNQFEAVSYTNGAYQNATTNLRNAFFSDEGIAEITGRSGTWLITTSKGRVLKWFGTSSIPTPISLPSTLQSAFATIRTGYQNATWDLAYCSHSIENDWCASSIVPISNGQWLIILAQSGYQSSRPDLPITAYRYDGSSFTDISDAVRNTTANDYGFLISSNGSDALISSYGIGNSTGVYYTLVSGTTVRSIGNTNATQNRAGQTYWTGSSWMLFTSPKQLYTLSTDGILAYVGEARDYFVTGASNNNGTVLLGGAVSALGNPQPTSPLTAKLSKVTESYVSTPTNNNTQTSGNLSTWTWLDPNVSSIANNQTATFNVGAWGAKGLSRIDIVVNGVTRHTCTYATAYGNQNCSYTLYGGDYNVGTTVSMNAMVTGADGKTMWSPLTNVYVTNADGTTYNPNPTPSNTNANASVWAWSSPEVSTIATNGAATFNLGSVDPDGISKIELYVNGSIWKTCNLGNAYNYQTCAVTVNGSSFTAGSDVFVNGKVTDIYGNTTWSGSRSYRIVSAASSASNQTANWIWSTPDVSSLTMNQSATFNVGAWDADGLNRTEIWVNGQLKQTCNFGNVVGNRDCSFVINANNYPVGTSVFVNAMMVDAKGNTTWSASRSYAITSSMYNQTTPSFPTNLPGSVSVTSNHDAGYSNYQYITYTASATDQNGLDRIELYVNGTLVKTCYNTSSCSWTGGYYNTRNYVNYGATIVDKAGYALWTGYKTIAKQ